jgi:hypothetical protein
MVCLIFNLMFNLPGKPGINVRSMKKFFKETGQIVGVAALATLTAEVTLRLIGKIGKALK